MSIHVEIIVAVDKNDLQNSLQFSRWVSYSSRSDTSIPRRTVGPFVNLELI